MGPQINCFSNIIDNEEDHITHLKGIMSLLSSYLNFYCVVMLNRIIKLHLLLCTEYPYSRTNFRINNNNYYYYYYLEFNRSMFIIIAHIPSSDNSQECHLPNGVNVNIEGLVWNLHFTSTIVLRVSN